MAYLVFMAKEIERKFKICGDFRPHVTESHRIRQGYIAHENGRTVRLRMVDGIAGFQRWKIKLALAKFAVRSAFYSGIRITATVPLPSRLRIVSVPRHIRSRRFSTLRSPT